MARCMTSRWTRRALALGVSVASVLGVGVAAASAATTPTIPCTTRATSAKFQPVDGDSAQYFTAPSGTFEKGTPDWTLTKASVTTGNEPRNINGPGTKSLLVTSGGKAVSTVFCNQYGEQSLRFFYKGTAGARIHLHLDVTDTSTNNWAPLDWEMQVPSNGRWAAANGIMIPPIYVQGKENLQITFLAIGGSVQVDDVEIDPFKPL